QWGPAAECLDYAFLAQGFDLGRSYSKPIVQNLGAVLPERRRSFQPHSLAVDPDRPGRHFVIAIVVMHGLHDAALLEARLVEQLHCVEYSPGRPPAGYELLH